MSEPPDGYKRLSFRIASVSPLIMHSGQLADPLNQFAREMRKVSSKRAKTDADHEHLAKLEWFGGLLIHRGAPCLPGEMIEAAFIEAAKKMKRGQQAKAGMISDGFWPLEYDGPRAPEELWEREEFRLRVGVRVQRNRVIRTRPIFRRWAATIEIDFLPDQLSATEVEDAVHTMGRVVGLGDWRPKFGRFAVAS